MKYKYFIQPLYYFFIFIISFPGEEIIPSRLGFVGVLKTNYTLAKYLLIILKDLVYNNVLYATDHWEGFNFSTRDTRKLNVLRIKSSYN